MKTIFAVIWAAVCGAFCTFLYRRLQNPGDESGTESPAEPLGSDGRFRILFGFLCAASGGACGFFTADNTDLISNMKLLIGICVLFAAALYDYRTLRIPNKLVVWLPISRLAFLVMELLTKDVNLVSRLVSSVVGAGFCLLVLILFSCLSKGGIGMGDIKLLSGLGFLLGFYSIIYIMILSCAASFVLSVVLLITKKKTMRDEIPMAPAILMGYIAVLILGLY